LLCTSGDELHHEVHLLGLIVDLIELDDLVRVGVRVRVRFRVRVRDRVRVRVRVRVRSHSA
jgi:hypothetical protein